MLPSHKWSFLAKVKMKMRKRKMKKDRKRKERRRRMKAKDREKKDRQMRKKLKSHFPAQSAQSDTTLKPIWPGTAKRLTGMRQIKARTSNVGLVLINLIMQAMWNATKPNIALKGSIRRAPQKVQNKPCLKWRHSARSKWTRSCITVVTSNRGAYCRWPKSISGPTFIVRVFVKMKLSSLFLIPWRIRFYLSAGERHPGSWSLREARGQNLPLPRRRWVFGMLELLLTSFPWCLLTLSSVFFLFWRFAILVRAIHLHLLVSFVFHVLTVDVWQKVCLFFFRSSSQA